MGFEAEPEPTSAPKLSLFSLPNQSPEPTGMLTPPLRPPASVPFQWEEAPGKPRGGCCREILSNDVARCLELPPRLLSEVKIIEIPSPTTVLEGPYITGRSSSFSSASFSKERFSDTGHSSNNNNKVIGQGYFGNWVKKNSSSFKGFGGQSAEDNIVISRSSSVSSSVFMTEVVNGGGGGGENFTKVKITRFRRRGSFLSLSNTSSQLWASIYGAVKQLVPWKRRKINRQSKSREEEEEEEESRDKLNFTTV
ncbi:hypothetical protein C5167_006353 [Papaver somniferum]|uniref:Uncharacterized protein n=1 Tax=Papaver somniferum TaxID=3469 RepID=A0A4Y7JGA6_PAPSO|nr:uncharacterized protein At4g00950-like [Papaver somniferum]RZC59050.1 hypothetical protein C5167_006353 [Papaver somniferum]